MVAAGDGGDDGDVEIAEQDQALVHDGDDVCDGQVAERAEKRRRKTTKNYNQTTCTMT